MNKPRPTPTLQPRFRVNHLGEPALGPGKAELLARIEQTGSIRQAAQQMDMSYMRAWSLIQTVNRCFKEPVLVPTRGGKTGGGAALTRTGKQVLRLYQQMETEATKATRKTWLELKALLKL